MTINPYPDRETLILTVRNPTLTGKPFSWQGSPYPGRGALILTWMPLPWQCPYLDPLSRWGSPYPDIGALVLTVMALTLIEKPLSWESGPLPWQQSCHFHRETLTLTGKPLSWTEKTLSWQAEPLPWHGCPYHDSEGLYLDRESLILTLKMIGQCLTKNQKYYKIHETSP